jgi:membrane associated rhomboid family serine protease
MFRRRGENLHSIYIFLFLNVAFFFLEYQDAARFATLFSFDRASFLRGEFWRVVTYQFSRAGPGFSVIPPYIILLLSLFILYLMGSALEEEWGTANFIAFFLVSTIATAMIASWLDVALIGSYFISYTLLFVYASAFPDQTFYLFAIVPIRVRWLANLVAGLLVYSILRGGTPNIPVLGGAIAGYVFFLLHRLPVPVAAAPKRESATDMPSVRNAARFVAIKRAIARGSDADVDKLITQCENEIVRGVNICPPADYKPEHLDGYCIRCEGFAECSARYLRLNRTKTSELPGIPDATV